MRNFVSSGKVIQWENGGSGTITSGSVVVMNGLIGIAVVDIAVGDTQSVNIEGIYEVAMNGAIPATGTPLAWDDTNHRADTDLTVGNFMGHCASQDCDLDGGVRVKLHEGGNKGTKAAHVDQVTTANASDLTTSEDLANQLKTTVNAILTSLQNGGMMAAS